METAKTFLARAQGQEVRVSLRDRVLKGRLEGWDEFINLYLEEAEEMHGGALRRIGRAVVRGSQVVGVHATKLGPPVAEAPRSSYHDQGGFERREPYRDRGFREGAPRPRWRGP